MILVAGATGTLGLEICRKLSQNDTPVRALVRHTGDPAKINTLVEAGVEISWGDLKDHDSLVAACRGVHAVISTASSTLSRQSGDCIETVDRLGQISLMDAANHAGVEHFTLVSIPREPVYESPLTRAKTQAEHWLIESGMHYTILAANYFMEIWLSPALGFDHRNRKAVIFGDGRAPMSWISYRDVAEFAMRSHHTMGARDRILEIGGPQNLSPLDVVQIFEQVSGAAFERQFVPKKALLAQLGQAADPLAESFAKLQLEYMHGCVMDSSQALRLMPMELATVESYAASVCGETVATA